MTQTLAPELREALYALTERTAREHGTTVEALYGRDRTARIVQARHRLWAVAHASTGMSLPELGRYFERDHTTILAGLRQHERRLTKGVK